MAPMPAKRSHAALQEDGFEPTHTHVSHVEYEDELEKLDSELQVAWNNALNPAFLATATAYEHVQVLMLSYGEDHSDMPNVEKEMDLLQAVFEKDYNFNVTRERIQHHKRGRKRPQTQINAIVASWVLEHESEKTLLIVYFAGHGERDEERYDEKSPEKLVLNGRLQSQFDETRYLNTIDWDRTENNLLNIGSDVLQIFDCCFAGAARNNRGGRSQICEYLAACDEKGRTKAPGDQSFTTALIWALKDLRGRRFTTTQLVRKIREEAPHFPKSQKPTLLKRRRHRDLHDNERLVLHPMRASGTGGSHGLKVSGRSSNNDFKQDVVTLKLIFESRPSSEHISKLGESLGHVIQGKGLDISSVVWCGLQPRSDGRTTVWENPMFHKAVVKFKSLLHKLNEADTPGLIDGLEKIVAEGVKDTLGEHLSKRPKLGD